MKPAGADRRWRAGVIAAGAGRRLRGGTHPPKPLVAVGGKTLIERVLHSVGEAGAQDVVVIVNEASMAVREHVMSSRWPFAIRWIVETTPSSMHSFIRVVETLAADGDPGPFLISTVDTIAPPGAYGRFAAACSSLDSDVVLAVAEPGDDETPLLVEVGSDEGRVDAMGPSVSGEHGSVFATAGYYAVRATILREADDARRDGVAALRGFFERLLDRGFTFRALRVPRGIDVDCPADLLAAEAFLKRTGA